MQAGRISRGALFPNFGQAVLLVVAMLLIQLGLGFAIGVAGAVFDSGMDSVSDLATNPWVLGVLNTVAIGAVLAFALGATREPVASFFRLRRFDLSLLPPVLLTSLSLAVVIDQGAKLFFEFMQLFPQWPVQDLSEAVMAVHPIGGFLLVVGVAPFTEEYLFRGMILRGLLARHGVRAAVLLSAILFGVMHANLLQFQLGLVIGCVFGWWYVRTGSIVPGLVGHGAFNAVAWFSTVFPLHFVPLGPSTGPDIVHQPLWFTLTAVAFAALGVWWFKGRADALAEVGVASGWEESIPEEPPRQEAPLPFEPPLLARLPPVLEVPPVLAPPEDAVVAAVDCEQPSQLELPLPVEEPPPVLAAEPPVLEPPVILTEAPPLDRR